MALPSDPFGRPCVAPGRLTLAQAMGRLRRVAGLLLASDDVEVRGHGRQLLEAIHSGQALDVAFGLRPPRGSRSTPRRLLELAAIQNDLASLVHMVGSRRAAARALGGHADVPTEAQQLLADLRRRGAPMSAAGIARALQRAYCDGGTGATVGLRA